jgi:hypothetical protein
MTNALARPQCETQAGLKLNEHNRPILKLFTDDAFGGKSQALLVEAQRGFKIVDANGDYGDSWLHVISLTLGA